MITPRPSSFRFFALAAAVGLLAANVSAQTPLVHYTLDGNGNDSGSSNFDGVIKNGASFTNTGAGVGQFNEALSTGDGSNDYFAADVGTTPTLGLDAITIALWVNIDSGAATDRLVSNLSGSTGFDFYLQSAGDGDYNLAFGFNSSSGATQSSSASYVFDQWLFLAVTYDVANATVSFYSGDLTNGVGFTTSAVRTGGGATSIAASVADVEIGGTPASTGDRSPIALFNDVRVYDSALTLSELEAIRVSAIPEPSSYGLLLGVASLGCIVLRRRRR